MRITVMKILALVGSGTVAAWGQGSAGTNATATAGLRECPIGEAIGAKYPEQTVLVTSVGPSNAPNIITLGWVMFCSGEPPMLAISVGKTRHSHKLIAETREFVCAFPGADLATEMLYCGTHSGRDVDKFKETGLTPVPAKKVQPPLIAECLANFECRVTAAVDAGDHTVFIGTIVAAWRSPDRQEQRRLFNLGKGQFRGLP
jgi:flavin reductase (DIM6/NTAB) family NADH-FMN oxidoreductase RutF